jgi:hypothetical protein
MCEGTDINEKSSLSGKDRTNCLLVIIYGFYLFPRSVLHFVSMSKMKDTYSFPPPFYLNIIVDVLGMQNEQIQL